MVEFVAYDHAIPDEELVRLGLDEDDSRAVVSLALRYRREVLRHLQGLIGDEHLAEDALQIADWNVIRAFHDGRFDHGRHFRPWYYSVAGNAARDLLRKEKRWQLASLDQVVGDDDQREMEILLGSSIGESMDPADHLMVLEDREWLMSAMDTLSDVQRSALHAVYIDGLSYAEAANRFGVPLGTIKSRLHTAILSLRGMRDTLT